MRLLAIWLSLASAAFAQVSATIAINTTQTTPLNANFSGIQRRGGFSRRVLRLPAQ
jgi:hypothetical protein